MQGVPEFMKQRFRIVHGDQDGFAGWGFSEIHDVQDDRCLALVVAIRCELMLLLQFTHPRAGSFGWPCEIIGQKNGDALAARIKHLEDADIGVIGTRILMLPKSDAKQRLSRMESGLDHPLQLQIRLYFRLVEIVSRGPRFFGIVTPVPWLDIVVLSFRRDQAR